eukprot:jgi/Tetstr1/465385/TSEL_010071.t1
MERIAVSLATAVTHGGRRNRAPPPAVAAFDKRRQERALDVASRAARPADSNSYESQIYEPGESSSGGESSQPASGDDVDNVGKDDDMEDRELNPADSTVA